MKITEAEAADRRPAGKEPRAAAAAAAGRIRADAKSRVTRLIGFLNDEDAVVRMKAARTLGALGAQAKDALPALRRRVNDEDEAVRAAVRAAIERMGTEPVSPAVQGLIDELASADSEVRLTAINALATLGAVARTNKQHHATSSHHRRFAPPAIWLVGSQPRRRYPLSDAGEARGGAVSRSQPVAEPHPILLHLPHADGPVCGQAKGTQR